MAVVRRVAVAAVGLVLLAGCAEPAAPPAPGRTPGPSPVVPTLPPTPTLSPAPTLPPAPTTSPPGKPVTVSGTVREGVEPGCLLIDKYLLVNAPTRVVYAGARVRLTLEVRTDLVSTCMQGTPAMIVSAQPL